MAVVTDTIADMLTRIRNANQMRYEEVKVPASNIKKEIIRQINESSEGGEQEADLLMIIKYLERIGDHATNIAEWVLFYITGEHPEIA